MNKLLSTYILIFTFIPTFFSESLKTFLHREGATVSFEKNMAKSLQNLISRNNADHLNKVSLFYLSPLLKPTADNFEFTSFVDLLNKAPVELMEALQFKFVNNSIVVNMSQNFMVDNHGRYTLNEDEHWAPENFWFSKEKAFQLFKGKLGADRKALIKLMAEMTSHGAYISPDETYFYKSSNEKRKFLKNGFKISPPPKIFIRPLRFKNFIECDVRFGPHEDYFEKELSVITLLLACYNHGVKVNNVSNNRFPTQWSQNEKKEVTPKALNINGNLAFKYAGYGMETVPNCSSVSHCKNSKCNENILNFKLPNFYNHSVTLKDLLNQISDITNEANKSIKWHFEDLEYYPACLTVAFNQLTLGQFLSFLELSCNAEITVINKNIYIRPTLEKRVYKVVRKQVGQEKRVVDTETFKLSRMFGKVSDMNDPEFYLDKQGKLKTHLLEEFSTKLIGPDNDEVLHLSSSGIESESFPKDRQNIYTWQLNPIALKLLKKAGGSSYFSAVSSLLDKLNRLVFSDEPFERPEGDYKWTHPQEEEIKKTREIIESDDPDIESGDLEDLDETEEVHEPEDSFYVCHECGKITLVSQSGPEQHLETIIELLNRGVLVQLK